MPFGLIHYRAPGATLDEFLDFAAASQFDAVELMIADVWPSDDPDPHGRAERVRQKLDERGLGVNALGAANDFVHLDKALMQQQIERMDHVCRLALIVGTGILRMEGGTRKPEVPPDREGDAIAEHLKHCVEFAQRDGLHLAVDNHGVVTNDAELLERVLKQVDSARVGANLDTANFRWAGHSIDACRHHYDRLAPYVLHVHLKDCIGSGSEYRGTVLGEGEVDLLHAVSALEAVGFRGPYTAEWEGGTDEDGSRAYQRCLDWMKRHLRRRP